MELVSKGDKLLAQVWTFFQNNGWYILSGFVIVTAFRLCYDELVVISSKTTDRQKESKLDPERERVRAMQQERYNRLIEEKGEAKTLKRKLTLRERLHTQHMHHTTDSYNPGARRWGSSRRVRS